MAPPRGAIVLLDGEVPTRRLLDEAWPGWTSGDELVVAADGGARNAEPLGLRIDRWVGDGDSVDPGLLTRLAASGTEILRAPVEKDETDAELAVVAALEAGPARITVLGGLGGPRFDHAVANLSLLDHPALRRIAVFFDARASRIRLMHGPNVLKPFGRVGDIVSLIPVGDTAHGVTTSYLRYPLVDEDLELGRTRGVSNVRVGPTARIQLESGRLLVIETPVTVGS